MRNTFLFHILHALKRRRQELDVELFDCKAEIYLKLIFLGIAYSMAELAYNWALRRLLIPELLKQIGPKCTN